MFRFVLALGSLLLPLSALAQAAPAPSAEMMREEQPSRAQVAQMIADRGYFEIDDLHRGRDGDWHCTAMAAAGKRVAVTFDKQGNISETELPPTRRQ